MGWVGGDGSNFNGYICETLIYNRKLSDYERNVVGVYLAEKYDLTTSYANVSPQPVTADLKAWFKADALNLNNNDSVTTWNDSSGNGNNITQGTSTNRPVYNTNVLNGHPGVYFSGFTTRKSLENQDTATLASKEFTIYAVLAPSASYQVWGIPLTLLYRGGGTNNPQQASVGWQENFPRLTHYSGSSSGQCYLDHQNASNVWSPCIVECLAGTQPADLTT